MVEPLAKKREALAEAHSQWKVVSEARELSAEAGMVLASELIDALPFWLVTRSEQEWRERRVGVIDGQFEFCEAKVKGELKEALMCVPDELVGRFPDGYETEVRPSTAQMLREMKSILSEGSLLLFDYGFAREDYYHPERKTGTIRTYCRHEAGENPLERVGEQDITAHVDWTSLVEDATKAGWREPELFAQGSFLTKAARDLLLEKEATGEVDASFVGQFQSLTHPGQLGSKFSVLRALV